MYYKVGIPSVAVVENMAFLDPSSSADASDDGFVDDFVAKSSV